MIAYTDGSCLGNPGKGGWAVYCPENGYEETGSVKSSTNNRMELTAIIAAMKVEGITKIITDSEYCVKGATTWVNGWIKRDWKTAAGTKVKNDDLWKELMELVPTNFQFEWVKAHDVNEHNNHVDKLAHTAASDGKEESVEEVRARLTTELERLEKRKLEILAILSQTI
jgi:ribonuclease HI